MLSVLLKIHCDSDIYFLIAARIFILSKYIYLRNFHQPEAALARGACGHSDTINSRLHTCCEGSSSSKVSQKKKQKQPPSPPPQYEAPPEYDAITMPSNEHWFRSFVLLSVNCQKYEEMTFYRKDHNLGEKLQKSLHLKKYWSPYLK